MERHPEVSPEAVERYLRSRPRWIRGLQWLEGKRYAAAKFAGRAAPVVVIAWRRRMLAAAADLRLAIEQDWPSVPAPCREAFEAVLDRAPGLIVVQLRRQNLCGCLGHRHMVVKEPLFSEPHEAFGGAAVGELDIAYERVQGWQPLPLTDTAFDSKFLEGSRLAEFHTRQLRLRLLSLLLHETNHMALPQETESVVRERSLNFYRQALASYVEGAVSTMSLTIDRSFSRFG